MARVGWARALPGVSVDSVSVDDLGRISISANFQGTIELESGPATTETRGAYLAQLGAEGDFVWTRVIEPSYAPALAQGALGDVYAFGGFDEAVTIEGAGTLMNSNPSAFLLSYDAMGVHRWTKILTSTLRLSSRDLEVAPTGELALTGISRGTLDFDGRSVTSDEQTGFTARYDRSGELLEAGNIEPMLAPDIAFDEEGRTYLVGEFISDFEVDLDLGGGPLLGWGGSDMYVVSHGPDGSYRWSKSLGGRGEDYPAGAATDAEGHLLVYGTFERAIGIDSVSLFHSEESGFLASYGVDGEVLWARALDGAIVWDAGHDTEKNIYLTGTYSGPSDFGAGTRDPEGDFKGYVASYTPGMDLRWFVNLDGAFVEAFSMAIAPDSSVYVVGRFSNEMRIGDITLTGDTLQGFIAQILQ